MPTLFDMLNLNKRTVNQPQEIFTDVANTDFMIAGLKEYLGLHLDNQPFQNQDKVYE